jgi:hypothetical protein
MAIGAGLAIIASASCQTRAKVKARILPGLRGAAVVRGRQSVPAAGKFCRLVLSVKRTLTAAAQCCGSSVLRRKAAAAEED